MNRTVVLKHEDTSLEATSLVELLCGEDGVLAAMADWAFQPDQARSEAIAGLGKGRTAVETARNGGLVLRREVFTPDGRSGMLACRLVLSNESKDPISVASLIPIHIQGNALRLGKSRAGQWAYLRQPRHKNDMPACIILGSTAPGVWDAVKGQAETGGMKRRDPSEPPPLRLVSSELTAIRYGDSSVVMGVLPLTEQFIQNILELTPSRQDLSFLCVEMQCDGQIVSPGGQVVSQWVVIDLDGDTFAAIEGYSRAVKAFHGLALPQRVVPKHPTLWCSWYYYGDGFTQKEAEENLDALEKRKLPFDAFLIDECWDSRWGDWEPNIDWPDLKGLVRRIKKAGYIPGIWTCPVLADPRSRLRYRHPDWLIHTRNGKPLIFEMSKLNCFVLDPTHPEVGQFIEDLFRRLTREYGFRYHKIDFSRAAGMQDAVYHDRTKNRAQAYRMAIEAIRRGIGPDSYLDICGGYYGPCIGLTDAQRSGSDVKSYWLPAPKGEESEGYGPFTIKQNTLRFWMNDLWDNDPDSLMVRRRPEPYRQEGLSLGLLTDTEALTSTLNQYLGGGLISFTENLAEVDDDRLFLLRHCSPSLGQAARPRDCFEGKRFPSIFDTEVNPRAKELGQWHTVSMVNWFDREKTFRLTLDRALLGNFAGSAKKFCLSAFVGGWTKLVEAGQTIEVGPLAPHACEVVKIQAMDASRPALLVTDGHFSMGGTEITRWEAATDGVKITVNWPWPVDLKLTVAPPEGKKFAGAAADGAKTVTTKGKAGAAQRIDLKYA